MTAISISIPKETRFNETRITLIPRDIKPMIEDGCKVYVEKDAGSSLGFDDDSYRNVGALIIGKEELWVKGKYIAKLLCPTDEEVSMLSAETHVSAFFYAGENYKIIQRMCSKKTYAYSYEYFQDSDGRFSMMLADGWISGQLAVTNAAFYLQSTHGGRGITLDGLHHDAKANVVVIGHGNVGSSAARMALSMGANVMVVGRTKSSLSKFSAENPKIQCMLINDARFIDTVTGADIVIGAILISTYDTPALITDAIVRKMKLGSIIVDVTCGYGIGYMPTADKITMPGSGPYEKHGVLHFKNPRLPAMAPLTAANNASKLYSKFIYNLAKNIHNTKYHDAVSENGKILHLGDIVHPHVLSDFAKIETEGYSNYELVDHLSDG